ncbi:unnamed protein product, partial [Polarella glacialis]
KLEMPDLPYIENICRAGIQALEEQRKGQRAALAFKRREMDLCTRRRGRQRAAAWRRLTQEKKRARQGERTRKTADKEGDQSPESDRQVGAGSPRGEDEAPRKLSISPGRQHHHFHLQELPARGARNVAENSSPFHMSPPPVKAVDNGAGLQRSKSLANMKKLREDKAVRRDGHQDELRIQFEATPQKDAKLLRDVFELNIVKGKGTLATQALHRSLGEVGLFGHNASERRALVKLVKVASGRSAKGVTFLEFAVEVVPAARKRLLVIRQDLLRPALTACQKDWRGMLPQPRLLEIMRSALPSEFSNDDLDSVEDDKVLRSLQQKVLDLVKTFKFQDPQVSNISHGLEDDIKGLSLKLMEISEDRFQHLAQQRREVQQRRHVDEDTFSSFHNELLQLVRKVDAHSADVAMKVYATTTSGDDAKLGKYLHQQIFGEPVDWPSQDMINTNDLSQQMQLVLVSDQDGCDDDWKDDQEEQEEQDFILTTDEVGEKQDEEKYKEVLMKILYGARPKGLTMADHSAGSSSGYISGADAPHKGGHNFNETDEQRKFTAAWVAWGTKCAMDVVKFIWPLFYAMTTESFDMTYRWHTHVIGFYRKHGLMTTEGASYADQLDDCLKRGYLPPQHTPEHAFNVTALARLAIAASPKPVGFKAPPPGWQTPRHKSRVKAHLLPARADELRRRDIELHAAARRARLREDALRSHPLPSPVVVHLASGFKLAGAKPKDDWIGKAMVYYFRHECGVQRAPIRSAAYKLYQRSTRRLLAAKGKSKGKREAANYPANPDWRPGKWWNYVDLEPNDRAQERTEDRPPPSEHYSSAWSWLNDEPADDDEHFYSRRVSARTSSSSASASSSGRYATTKWPRRSSVELTERIDFAEHFAAEHDDAPVEGQMTFVDGVCYSEPLALGDWAPEPPNYNDDPDVDFQ